MESKLTDKQKRFCEEYLIDLNATQAAIRAGYSEDSARQIASDNLSKHDIQEYIKELQKELSERTKITAEMVVLELAKVGFANISDYLRVYDREIEISQNEDGEPIKATVRDVEIFETDKIDKAKLSVISEIKRTRDGISLRMHDKVKALEDLGKHLGIFEKDNKQKGTEITISDTKFNIRTATDEE